jgi:hypothetical protein
MSIINGTSPVIDNSLVLYFDMYNTKNSWKGKPITNQFAIPTPDSNDNVTFAVQGTGTFKRVFRGIFGGYEIQPEDIVYRYDLGLTGCHYHGNSATLTSGQWATFTFDYYISPDAANYITLNYLANMENTGSGAGNNVTAPNNIKGTWQTATFTTQATATGGINMYLYPGACSSSYLASSGYILYKNPQVIFGSTASEIRPFVAGTRASTAAILDLTKNYTITATSLTYNSNGTFSFSGADRLNLTMTGSSALTQYTRIVWVKPTATSGDMKSAFLNQIGNNADLAVGIEAGYPAFHQYTKTGTSGTTDGDWTLRGATLTSINNVYMIAVTVDRSITTNNIKVYLNGNIDATGSRQLGAAVSDNVIFGGPASDDYAGSRMWYGDIYSAYQYNRVLSDLEILQNFNAHRRKFGL